MDEARRQAYLAALGVDLYLARQPLPHAAPSWLGEWELEARHEDDPTLAHDDIHAEPSVAGDALSASDNPRSAIEALAAKTALSAADVRGAGSAPSVPAAPLTVPVLRNLKPESSDTTAAPPKKPAPLRVGLAVFEWPGQLRVLIEMADADAPSLSSREHRLWNEIALALYGREQAYDAQTVPVFRFPPSPGMRNMETPEAIRDGVEGFLQARQSRSAVAVQMLFAGSGLAAAYTGERGATLLEPRQVDMAGARLLLPSFMSLMEDSRLKAPAWRAMALVLRQAGLRR